MPKITKFDLIYLSIKPLPKLTCPDQKRLEIAQTDEKPKPANSRKLTKLLKAK